MPMNELQKQTNANIQEKANLIWEIACQKTTRPELAINEIKTMFMLLPKEKHLQDIAVDYIEQKSNQVDKLISIKQHKIEKLTQYKKSLIYEYVTGKKEVQ